MKEPETTVVGISLGTRSIGFAALKDGILLDWKVQCFKDTWSKTKCSLITGAIKKYLVRYEPDYIALKTPAEERHSKQLRVLLSTLSKQVESKQLPLYCYTLLDLKDCFGCASKDALVEAVANHCPELTHTFKKVQRYKNGYYSKTFEAIASAMLCASFSHK